MAPPASSPPPVAPARGLWRAALAEPGRLALVDVDGAEVTAGELLARGNRLVHGLRALGLGPGDTVALFLGNGSPFVEVLVAAMQAGWYVTAVNSHLAAPEVAYVLADAGADAVIFDASTAPVALAACAEAGIEPARRFCAAAETPDGATAYAALSAGQPDELPADRVHGTFLQYTSGTTGRPKGVRRPIRDGDDPDLMAPLIAAHLHRFGIEAGGGHVHLCTSPLYHMAPLAFAWFSLQLEHPVVLMRRWDAAEALRLIERHRVTTTHVVPTHLHRLLRLPAAVRDRHDLSSLRRVVHAAAPCPVETKRAMLAWWGPVLWEYYGATEGGGTLASPEEWLEHPGTVGRAWEGAEVHVLDDDGEPCPPGTPGTVWMKVLAPFEYKGDPDKTRRGRRGDLFTVGDVGRLDEDGYLFLCDRKIDLIIAGGVNVYPAEVEAALLQHPAVADAAVFGIPDADLGEQVKAVVELVPRGDGAGDASPSPADLIAFCAGRIARHECPRTVDVVDALPRDPSGKLHKRRLRDPYWQGTDRRI